MSSFDYSIYYGRYHDGSEKHAEEMERWSEDLLKPHLPSMKSIKILDIGCGHGFALRALRHMGFANLTGLEVSAEQADRSRAAGFPVEVVEDSTHWLRQRPAHFDLVLLLDVLEHVPAADQILFARAIYNCLTPAGRLILTVPNASSLLASRWRYNDFTHHSSFTEHSLDFVLRNAGFNDIKVDASKGIGRFPRRFWLRRNRAAIRKWMIRWCWLQVFKAEVPWENTEAISFDLNLTALAVKCV